MEIALVQQSLEIYQTALYCGTCSTPNAPNPPGGGSTAGEGGEEKKKSEKGKNGKKGNIEAGQNLQPLGDFFVGQKIASKIRD